MFRKDNTICIVNKNRNEPIHHYNERGYFIVCQKPTNKNEYNKAVIYSNIFINVKYLKCSYNTKIMENLTTMTNNLYI